MIVFLSYDAVFVYVASVRTCGSLEHVTIGRALLFFKVKLAANSRKMIVIYILLACKFMCNKINREFVSGERERDEVIAPAR